MARSSSKTLLGRQPAPSAQVQQLLADAPEGKRYAKQCLAVLFTDIVGSTAFFEQRGDEAGMAMVERHNGLLFPVVERHGGTVIKTIGDAIMASFPDAASAVQSGVGMQAQLKEHNSAQPPSERIRVRIGINFGEVICQDGDLFGDVVNAAARVEALARGDQILISAHTQEQLPENFPFPRHLYDAVRVRGKQEPMEIFRVDWDPDAPAEDASPLPPVKMGQVLGQRFEIIELLGEGGMGQVVRARDMALDEEVALKFMRPDLVSDPGTLERFKSEIRLARSVTHPHICRLHEFMEMDGHSFLSMELVRGRCVEDLLAEQGRLELDEVRWILAGVCTALQAAHDKGIIHRDLKPANVMLEDESRRVVLMDFGIAGLNQAKADQGDGSVAGTPDYMSPEQVRGESLGPPSDLYSLGVILYQLLSARLPHEAETPMAVAIKHVTEEPEDIQGLRPDLPPEMLTAVKRCLSKEPKQRFESADALGRFALGDDYQQILARTEPAPSLLPWMAGLALFMALLAGGLWWGLRDPSPPPAAKTELLVSSDGACYGARFDAKGKRVAFIQESQIWLLDQQQEHPVSQQAQALESMELGGLTWLDAESLLFVAEGQGRPTIRGMELQAGGVGEPMPNAASPDRSPDGRHLAFSSRNRLGSWDLVLADPAGRDRKVLLGGSATHSYLRPRFSPDGRELALVVHQAGYQSTRDIGVYNLDRGELRMLTRDGIDNKADNTDPCWAPAGKWLAYASRRAGTSSLWWVPSEGGESHPLSQNATEDQRQPDISPDGKRVLFQTQVKQLDVELVYLKDGGRRPLTQKRRPDRFPMFSRDDQHVLYRSEGTGKHFDAHRVVRYDLMKQKRVSRKGPRGLRDFTPCGPDTLAFSATRGADRLLGLLDAQGEERLLATGFHRLWSPVCTPDGQTIAFVGQRKRSSPRALWTMSIDQPEPRRLSPDDGVHSHPVFSDDGERLAYRWAPSMADLGESELRVMAWPADDSSKARVISRSTSFRGSRRRLRFSGDGAWIYYMQNRSRGGRLWRVPSAGGAPQKLIDLPHAHTFDFDIDADGARLVYARANVFGNLHQASNEDWEL